MGRGDGAVLVALQVVYLCLQAGVAAAAAAAAGGVGLPPLLSPILDGLCSVVQCGKGSCKVSPEHAFGFVCECERGWTKIHFGDHFQFLPCVIPKCTFDYSCINGSTAPPHVGLQPPSNRSLFDPCTWSYCGEGACVKSSDFGHKCDCKPGYANILNATIFPCFKECVYGADCEEIGITLPHGSASDSTSSPPPSGNRAAATGFPRSWIWISLMMISLGMAPRI